ncbi:MAG: acetyltransferase [Bacteroidota bacterium]
MPTSKAYQDAYLGLPEQLTGNYPELNFKNHCYLRIALDQVFQAKWDTKIPKPAHKHLNGEQLEAVRNLLTRYLTNKALLLQHNMLSLHYRKEAKGRQQELSFKPLQLL